MDKLTALDSSLGVQQPDDCVAIWRRRRVEQVSGYSRSTLYLRISQGLWPRPVNLGPRAVGWPASEVSAMNAARIAGKDETEIRALVTRLTAGRARENRR
jgi:prophage regulatory protein